MLITAPKKYYINMKKYFTVEGRSIPVWKNGAVRKKNGNMYYFRDYNYAINYVNKLKLITNYDETIELHDTGSYKPILEVQGVKGFDYSDNI